jgi:hypothetical protein
VIGGRSRKTAEGIALADREAFSKSIASRLRDTVGDKNVAAPWLVSLA